MSNAVHIFGLLGIVVFWLLPAYLAGRVADRKGRSFRLYALAGLVLGPLVLVASLLLRGRRRAV